MEISEFIAATQTGHASNRISILNIPDYYDALVEYLRGQAMPGEELTRQVQSNLRGICPLCSAWADSSRLFMLSFVRKAGREKMRMTRYGPVSRLRDGHCQLDNCASRDIILIWGDEPQIKLDINFIMDRLNNENNKPIKKYCRADVLHYTTDAIANIAAQNHPHHVYCGRRFDDIHVWVSVITGIREVESLRKHVFPQGYTDFFNKLLSESEYDSKDIAVIHWICAPNAVPRFLGIAFLAERSQISESQQQGSVVLPLELLNEQERRRLDA